MLDELNAGTLEGLLEKERKSFVLISIRNGTETNSDFGTLASMEKVIWM